MGEDLSTGAKIGIILIILVALIGIVFALLTMMKNITNSGSNQLQNSLDQMSKSNLSDYDQKKVSGTSVLTAIKMFEAQDMAIIVKSVLSDANNGENTAGGYCYNAVLEGYTKASKDNSVIGTGYGAYYSSDQNINIIANGYKGTTDVKWDGTVTEYKGIYPNEGKTYYIGRLAKDDTTGSILFNMNTRPTTASGYSSYIRDNATYRSWLIKDASGTVIGICFNEMDKTSDGFDSGKTSGDGGTP